MALEEVCSGGGLRSKSPHLTCEDVFLMNFLLVRIGKGKGKNYIYYCDMPHLSQPNKGEEIFFLP